MSSDIYASYPNLLKAEIGTVIKLLRLSDEESHAGKTIILLAYIMDTAGAVPPDRLMMPDVKTILDRGFGWKVRRCFRQADAALDGQYHRFKVYLRYRMSSCYKRRFYG